ncbi:MAG: UDP-N-acetylmuramoyl-tripeptide--D-alanyl-D-alanine ligase [Patescibacteria group bacterium]
MRQLFKKIVVWILRKEAKAVLWRFKPTVIGVTGSVGKTSTKEAIRVVLEARYKLQTSPKSYNSEIGLPLTILGQATAWDELLGWLKVISRGLMRVISRAPYPGRLLAEFGVDRPGDMDRALMIAKPAISVITPVGEVPVHVEFFAGPKELAQEKEKLARAVPEDGYVILNYDDETVRKMGDRLGAHVMTYGFSERADVRAAEEQLLIRKEDGASAPEGTAFLLDYKDQQMPVRLIGAFGKPHIYAALAGAAVGIANGMQLEEIAEALSRYTPPPGRMRLIEGIKNTLILDDTYNASPLAMHAAFDLLRDLSAKRKIAVIGDMLEIGKYTPEAHRAIVRRFPDWGDLLVTVGPRARFAAEEAKEHGMAEDRIWSFSRAEEVEEALQPFLEEGDLILVKGSQAMRLEKFVETIMAHPERAGELLCRQESFWKKR